MGWKDRAKPVSPETEQEAPRTGSWKDRAKAVAPEVSQTESGVRGAAQGLSFGFADEATGAAEAALDWVKNDPSGFMDNYKKHRDESRKNYKGAEEANPGTFMAGQVAGAIAPALLSGGASTAATVGNLAMQGAAQGLGSSEADLTEGDVLGAAKDTALGGVIGGATGVAGKALSKIPVGKIAEKASGYLGRGAEKLAENATGATANQALKFEANAGRELLDRGLVKFGDTAENIAERVGKAKSAAGKDIGDSLAALDAKGVTSSVDNVVAQLESKIDELSRTPGNERIIKQMQAEVDNLYNRGASNLPVSEGELAKRNFHGQVNNFSPEADKKAAGYVGDAFMGESERAATAAEPELAEKFMQSKKDYKLFSPIEEASERRAAQQAQAPFAGMGDLAAAVPGMLSGGPLGAIGSVAAKRLIAPRVAASGAVLSDQLASYVAKSPQMFGRFAPMLQEAAKRGTTALAARHYILSQTEPEYRKIVNGDKDEQEQQ